MGNDTVDVNVADNVGRFFVLRGEQGGDNLDATDSSLAVTIFGDQSSDTVKGGSNADQLVGDEGRAYYLKPAGATGFDIVLGGKPEAQAAGATADATFTTVDFLHTMLKPATDANDNISGNGAD